MLGSKETKQTSSLVQFARVLPNNATTAKILKEEEERARAKEEREKAVSRAKRSSIIGLTILTLNFTYRIA